MKGKNVFIGICTKKERVLGNGRFAFFDTKQWKTSDWIIQEIGVAKGMGLDLILLIEEGLRKPGELQGNMNHIMFKRSAPEKAYNEIFEMLSALSPKETVAPVTAAGNQPAPDQIKTAPQKLEDDISPKPQWRQNDYEWAFMRNTFSKNDSAAEAISKFYLATEEGSKNENKCVWKAFCEFVRILEGRGGGSLTTLKAFAEENPKSSRVWKYLGSAHIGYEDFCSGSPKLRTRLKERRGFRGTASAHGRCRQQLCESRKPHRSNDIPGTDEVQSLSKRPGGKATAQILKGISHFYKR